MVSVNRVVKLQNEVLPVRYPRKVKRLAGFGFYRHQMRDPAAQTELAAFILTADVQPRLPASWMLSSIRQRLKHLRPLSDGSFHCLQLVHDRNREACPAETGFQELTTILHPCGNEL